MATEQSAFIQKLRKFELTWETEKRKKKSVEVDGSDITIRYHRSQITDQTWTIKSLMKNSMEFIIVGKMRF